MLSNHHISTLRKEPVTGNRMGKAIELAGVTQRTVARALDVPESYVSDLVRQRYKAITVPNAHRYLSSRSYTIKTGECEWQVSHPPRRKND